MSSDKSAGSASSSSAGASAKAASSSSASAAKAESFSKSVNTAKSDSKGSGGGNSGSSAKSADFKAPDMSSKAVNQDKGGNSNSGASNDNGKTASGSKSASAGALPSSFSRADLTSSDQNKVDVYDANLSRALAFKDNSEIRQGKDAMVQRLVDFLGTAERTQGVDTSDGLSGAEYKATMNSIDANPQLKQEMQDLHQIYTDKFQNNIPVEIKIGGEDLFANVADLHGEYGSKGDKTLNEDGNENDSVFKAADNLNLLTTEIPSGDIQAKGGDDKGGHDGKGGDRAGGAGGAQSNAGGGDTNGAGGADAAGNAGGSDANGAGGGDTGGGAGGADAGGAGGGADGAGGDMGIEELMQLLDADGDGQITAEELSNFLAKAGESGQLSGAMADLMKLVDKNGDGSASAQEVSDFAKSIDKNGNGCFSMQEITTALQDVGNKSLLSGSNMQGAKKAA